MLSLHLGLCHRGFGLGGRIFHQLFQARLVRVSAAGYLAATSQGACLHRKQLAALCAHASRQAGRGGRTDDRLDAAAGLACRLVAHHVLIPLLQSRHTRCANPLTVTPLLVSRAGPRLFPLRAVGRGGSGGEAGLTFEKVSLSVPSTGRANASRTTNVLSSSLPCKMPITSICPPDRACMAILRSASAEILTCLKYRGSVVHGFCSRLLSWRANAGASAATRPRRVKGSGERVRRVAGAQAYGPFGSERGGRTREEGIGLGHREHRGSTLRPHGAVARGQSQRGGRDKPAGFGSVSGTWSVLSYA